MEGLTKLTKYKRVTTKKDLLDFLSNDLKDVPDNTPISLYRGAFYADLELAAIKKLWSDGKQENRIVLEPGQKII